MTALITILSVILLFVVLLQIAKINDITSEIKGDEETQTQSSDLNGKWLMIFCVLFLGSFFGVHFIILTDYLDTVH